jgi:hypothetical protein
VALHVHHVQHLESKALILFSPSHVLRIPQDDGEQLEIQAGLCLPARTHFIHCWWDPHAVHTQINHLALVLLQLLIYKKSLVGILYTLDFLSIILIIISSIY